jgi:predicted ATP-grasp superfamily ATP-dependent carboligase
MRDAQRILLTGGRAPATLELARLFYKAGHIVFIAESVAHPLTRLSRSVVHHYLVPSPRFNPTGYIDALLDIVKRNKIDVIIPTCEEIFTIGWGCGQLEKECRVFAEVLARLEPLHNKWEFIERAKHYGLSVPRTMLIASESDLQRTIESHEMLVLKPIYSRFAAKIIFLRGRRDPTPTIKPTSQIPWVAQQFIYGQQICTYSIVHNGRIAAHTAYPAEFTAGRGAAVLFRHIDHAPSLAWVKKFVAAENFTGQIAFDFIETLNGDLYALECNPRATSGVHLLASNPQFVKAFWDNQSELVTPMGNGSAMLAAAMMLYALPSTRSWGKLKQWAASFASSRDVIFAVDDPLPVFSQLLSVVFFLWRGLMHGVSALESSTMDIEWNGESVDGLNRFV